MEKDKALVKKTVSGEQEAFEAIVMKYQRPILNFIFRRCRDYELSLEFTQDVFFKTYISIHTYNPEYPFKNWIYKIAANHVGDYLRIKKVKIIAINQMNKANGKSFSFQIPTKEHSVSKKVELAEIREKIEEVLNKLPDYLKELFVWRHFYEFSYKEISAIKSIPEGTIKNRIFKTRTLIREHLDEV